MLGIVVVNSSNDIVQSFGNKIFSKHVELLKLEGNPGALTATSTRFSSSSSGVSSLAESPNSIFNHESTSLLKTNKSNKIDDNALIQYILPLLAIYQAKKSNGDELTVLHSDNVKFCFVSFDNSHMIVSICDESFSEIELERISQRVQNLLNFYFGPFIHFIKTDLSSIKKKKLRIEKRIFDVIQDAETGKLKSALLNVNTLVTNPKCYLSFMPKFRKISLAITEYIGNNRCIFVSRGHVIGSISSRQKKAIPLFELLDSEDVNNLIQMCQLINHDSNPEDPNQARKKLQHHVEQIWVHFRSNPSLPSSSKNTKRQLVNAFLFSLSGEIDLICLNAVDQSPSIHIISDLLEMLDEVETAENRQSVFENVDERVQKLVSLMTGFKTRCSLKELKCMFLENTARTSTLIRNLWTRLYSEMSTPAVAKVQSSRRGTLSAFFTATSNSTLGHLQRWGSSASLVSNANTWMSSSASSSTMTSSSMSTKSISIQTLAMIRHFQRQLRLLLNELCNYSSFIAKSEKYKLAECGIKRVMDKTTDFFFEPLFSDSNTGLVDSEKFLNPQKLGFDMNSYVFYRTDLSMNVYSYQDKHFKLFLHSQRNPASSDMTIARLEDGQLFIQITGSPSQGLGSEKMSCLDIPVICSSVFPEMINMHLAIHQTMKLATFLHHRTNHVLQMFE